jgi:hypothetical protein
VQVCACTPHLHAAAHWVTTGAQEIRSLTKKTAKLKQNKQRTNRAEKQQSNNFDPTTTLQQNNKELTAEKQPKTKQQSNNFS